MSEVFHGYDERLDRAGDDQAAPPAVGIGCRPARTAQRRALDQLTQEAGLAA